MKEPYYLTDPETGRRDPEPFMMDCEEARRLNERLDGWHKCRYRWKAKDKEETPAWSPQLQ